MSIVPSPSTTSTRSRSSVPATSSVPVNVSPSSTSLPAALLGRDWTRIPTDRKIVALTFDAGGNDAGVAAILATLSLRK